jgi:hypothetical protein
MNADQENFDQLRRLLTLKRHEQPPPGYFKDFSQEVIMQIRAGGPEQAAAGRLVWDAPWLQRFWSALEHNPLMAGAFGVLVCGLLISGLIYSENMARLPEVGAIGTDQPGNPTTVVDNSNAGQSLFTQAAPTDFPSTIAQPAMEPRGSLFEEFQNSRPQAKPVLFNVPEGGIKP